MKSHHTVRLVLAGILILMGWNTVTAGFRAAKALDRMVADKVEQITELSDY